MAETLTVAETGPHTATVKGRHNFRETRLFCLKLLDSEYFRNYKRHLHSQKQ